MKNREKGNGKREEERKIGIGKWNRNFFFYVLRLKNNILSLTHLIN